MTDNKRPTGQRSPRWALWKRMTIPCESGLMYLARLRIVQTPWFGVYVHDIFELDGDRDPHNHPWPFLSVILRGYYVEHFHPDPTRDIGQYETRRWRRGSIHRMGRDSAHRITRASEGLKTLIIVGRRAGSWGFFVENKYGEGELVDWWDYEHAEGY